MRHASRKGAILITGASSGIGRACVERLAAGGALVFAGVRRLEDAPRGERIVPLELDVTHAKSIGAAAEYVRVALKDEALAALVNNAGVCMTGPLLDQPLEEMRAQMEVNAFAPIAVTRAFGPMLAKHGAATIVMIGSTAGEIAAPFLGAYSASKHALEAVSDALRRELGLFGTRVVLVRPGAVATPFFAKLGAEPIERYDATRYRESYRAFRAFSDGAARQAMNAESVARAVARVIASRKPPTRITLVRGRTLNWTLPRLLTDAALDAAMARRFRLALAK